MKFMISWRSLSHTRVEEGKSRIDSAMDRRAAISPLPGGLEGTSYEFSLVC
jgi:hypothetical protein